ncbi:MAG: hypothetical protein RLZZ265_669 [Verrucomicrobiota bacterium]
MRLRDTARHNGPGVVHYGDGDRSPEWSQVEPESQYKRHNYTMGGMMLSIGLFLWFVLARAAKNDAAKSEAKEEYLEAQIRRAAAYHCAFASAVDDATRERATAEARLSGEFRDARDDEELASRIYYATAKAAKGDTE